MKPRVRHVRDVRRLAAAALGKGAVITGPGVIRWNVSGKCLTPRYVEVRGRGTRWGTDPHAAHAQPTMEFWVDGMDDPPATLEILAKCRRCAPCLKARSLEWTYRAKRELQAAARTWFGTMTLSPDEHWLASCRWERSKAGRKWAELSPDEQFRPDTK